MQSIPRSAGIYRIDGPHGRVYIGSSINLHHRWLAHRNELNHGRHKATHMQSAWKKYGASSFTFTVIELVDDINDLLRKEQLWLDILFTSLESEEIYNTCRFAYSRRGTKTSEETRQRLSDAWKRMDGGTRQRLAEGLKGNSHARGHKKTEAGLRKLSETSKGNTYRRGSVLSEETRHKLSESGRAQWARLSDDERAKTVAASREWWEGLSDAERAAHGRKNSAAWARKSDAEKEQISLAAQARWAQRSDEERAQISAKLCAASTIRGKPRTDEVKRKLSEAHKGKTRPPEELRNLSKGHRKGKIYTMIAPDGTIYEDIDSLASFAKEHGMTRETVHNILIGKYKNKAGWRGFITYEDT